MSKTAKTILYICALVCVLIGGAIIRGAVDQGATDRRIADLENTIIKLSGINQQLAETNKQLADDQRAIEAGLNGLAGTAQDANGFIFDAIQTSDRLGKLVETLADGK